jgi:hypothetical protein
MDGSFIYCRYINLYPNGNSVPTKREEEDKHTNSRKRIHILVEIDGATVDEWRIFFVGQEH